MKTISGGDLRQATFDGSGIVFQNHIHNPHVTKSPLRTVARIAIAVLLLGVSAVAAGYQPGAVAAWGNANYGLANVPVGLTNVIAIAAGGTHSLALQANGVVRAWGFSDLGQTSVPVGLKDVRAVSGGGFHSLALKADGSVIAWGSYYNGSQYLPMTVPAGLTDVMAIASGSSHGLALKTNGAVVAWGYYHNGTTTVPMTVPGGMSPVQAIACGGSHNLVLQANGNIFAWGNNKYGQLNIPPGLANVSAIAAGSDHNLVLRSDGTVSAWGRNLEGQTNVPPGLSNVVAVAARNHSMALKADGTIIVWGWNNAGQTNVPVELTNAFAVAAGGAHSLALVTPGPQIWPTPTPSQSLALGGDTNISISVRSKYPFSCQWFFNDSPIISASETNFLLSSFDITRAGAYSVVVSNSLGIDSAKISIRLANSPVVSVDGLDEGGGLVARVDSSQVTMSNTGSGTAIYFTLDGSAPDFTDVLYGGPFTLTNTATIRAIAYNSNYTDSAEAATITVQMWPTYPLGASTLGGGSVAVSPAAYTGNRYVSNTVVMLTATPSNGWSFLNWTGDSISTGNVTTVLMDRPRSVQAVFGTTLNLFSNGNGQILLNPATGPYAFGSPVQLTAVPAAGSYFFGWGGAASGFANPLLITATNTSGITALFGALNPNQVSLTVLPNGDGSVLVNPSKNVYTSGEMVTLTALPWPNRIFTGWSTDATGNLNPLSLTLTASTVVTANFAPGSPTIPPVITPPPLSRTVSEGASTLLSFGLTGDGPFTYQWRLNHLPIFGATNPTLPLIGVTPAQAGLYDVIVNSPSGAATSAPASVALFGMDWTLSSGSRLPLLILDAAPGLGYRLEYSWNLSSSNWHLLAPVTMQGSRLYYVDSLDTNSFRRFYRAVPQ